MSLHAGQWLALANVLVELIGTLVKLIERNLPNALHAKEDEESSDVSGS